MDQNVFAEVLVFIGKSRDRPSFTTLHNQVCKYIFCSRLPVHGVLLLRWHVPQAQRDPPPAVPEVQRRGPPDQQSPAVPGQIMRVYHFRRVFDDHLKQINCFRRPSTNKSPRNNRRNPFFFFWSLSGLKYYICLIKACGATSVSPDPDPVQVLTLEADHPVTKPCSGLDAGGWPPL